ncbi:MAG: hypothetical protein DI568_05985 [Sphingomonas sp.]|nr:MAG: hypothetical protein DI568_05985 [Sphingomonas sp.]
MKLEFRKLSGKYDRLSITRADGSTTGVDCPKQGMIPHDMVHYAVESVLAGRGFLSNVRDGAGADFTDGSSEEAEPVERLVETMQADTWSMGGATPVDELIALYELGCEARGHGAAPVTADDIAAIRARMDDLARQWAAVPLNGSLILSL